MPDGFDDDVGLVGVLGASRPSGRWWPGPRVSTPNVAEQRRPVHRVDAGDVTGANAFAT